MGERREGYWSKHHWAIVQCILAFYCAVFATWAFFNPHPAPAATQNPTSAPHPSAGAAMTAGYSMPFWLWVGIVGLALSVAVPAILGVIRKRKKSAAIPIEDAKEGVLHSETPKESFGAPQELRTRMVSLIGALSAYLVEHQKKLRPRDDPNTTGFEVLPDESEITSTFSQRFESRLLAVHSSLGSLGLLGELLGTPRNKQSMLELGANNAGDVREIVKLLERIVVQLDIRYGMRQCPTATVPEQSTDSSTASPVPKVRVVKVSIDNRGNATLTFKNLGNSKAFQVIVTDWVEAGHYVRASTPIGNGPPGWIAKFSTKDSLRSFTSRALDPEEEFTHTWPEDTEEKCKLREEYPAPNWVIQSRGDVTYTNSTGSSGFRSNFCYIPKVASHGWTIAKCDCIGGNEDEEQQ